MTLRKLVRKICNGSTSSVGEDALGNLMESSCNFFFARGNDYESLLKYLEMENHRCSMLTESGFYLATDNLRYHFMVELLSRGQSESLLHGILLQCKNTPRDKSGAFDVEIGKETIMRAFRARVLAKHAGREFEDLRRDVCNGNVVGIKEHMFNIIEVSCQMEDCQPI